MSSQSNSSMLLIVGAGGLGREIAATALSLGDWTTIAFVDDNAVGEVNDLTVWGTVHQLSITEVDVDVFIGVGNPIAKQEIFSRLRSNPHLNFPSVIHPNARVHWPEYVRVGKGSYLADGVIVTTNVEIGDFVLLNLSSTVGHDAKIGDFSSIMPSVNISGGAQLEEGVFVGTGAKLIKSSTLGRNCVIGAGAVVNTNVPTGETWGGIPAKPLH